ncbi:hypothetical protein RRG08_031881 [Elysia crispata]|uniref:Uncharacterized protein n=1 Tax=Elysia crispata TaxID=231223 RepID=A0AAE1DZ43_9GAST|nr:hypothetical protein RRG08_031881 [Elysia crispata]
MKITQLLSIFDINGARRRSAQISAARSRSAFFAREAWLKETFWPEKCLRLARCGISGDFRFGSSIVNRGDQEVERSSSVGQSKHGDRREPGGNLARPEDPPPIEATRPNIIITALDDPDPVRFSTGSPATSASRQSMVLALINSCGAGKLGFCSLLPFTQRSIHVWHQQRWTEAHISLTFYTLFQRQSRHSLGQNLPGCYHATFTQPGDLDISGSLAFTVKVTSTSESALIIGLTNIEKE